MRTTGGSSGGTLLDARLYATLAAAGTAVLRATSRHQVYVTLAKALTERGDFDVACVAVRDDDAEDGFRIVADGSASAAGGLDLRSVGSTAWRINMFASMIKMSWTGMR